MLIAVNFHYVRPSFDAPHPGIHGVTPAELERQLRLLGTLGEFVSGPEICQAVRGAGRLPHRSLIVTFDDGLREQAEHALPVLDRLGIPALFFVNTGPIVTRTVARVHKVHLTRSMMAPTDFSRLLRARVPVGAGSIRLDEPSTEAIRQYPYDPPESAQLKYALNFLLTPDDRDALVDLCFAELFESPEAQISEALYLSPDDLWRLGARGAVGTHGDDHVPLGLLSAAEARASIRRSLDHLERWTGRRPYAMSYPYGSPDASAEWLGQVAAAAGVAFAFTMERAANPTLERPMHLARFDCNDLPGGNRAVVAPPDPFESAPARSWFLAATGER